jgi:YegS/Rv2252/BmrU family lipid kinase
MPRPVCLIVNPSAGGGRAAQRLPGVEAALRTRGVQFRVERTSSLEHARSLGSETLETGEIAAVMGGDGITGAVAHVLRRTDGVLGVVPGGRGNDLARKLGIATEPEVVADILAGGNERMIDVAEADGKTFLGIVSAGIDSDVQEIALTTRLRLGGFVYLYGALRALSAWKPAGWKIVIDGAPREFTGYSVAVANSGVFGGGMWLVPDAEIDDGVLEVVISENVPKRRYLAGLGKVFKGTHLDKDGIHVIKAREVTFEADRPFTAYADGDPIAVLPTTVRVVPGSLRVLVP